jgi:hypothetical protein
MLQTAELVLKSLVDYLNVRFEVIDNSDADSRGLDFPTVKRAFRTGRAGRLVSHRKPQRRGFPPQFQEG